MTRPGDQFIGDALFGVSLLATAVTMSVARAVEARAIEDERHLTEWSWVDVAEYWRARALRAEAALVAAESALDELA
jgi:hypothetical protein